MPGVLVPGKPRPNNINLGKRRVGVKNAARLRKSDPRVSVIRCDCCHRLRAHPRTDDSRTHFCGCGASTFIESYPHHDEVSIAKKLYRRELDECGIYLKIGQEVLDGWRHEDYSYLEYWKPKKLKAQ